MTVIIELTKPDGTFGHSERLGGTYRGHPPLDGLNLDDVRQFAVEAGAGTREEVDTWEPVIVLPSPGSQTALSERA